MKCEHCGESIDETMNMCPNCLKPIHKEPEVSETEIELPAKKEKVNENVEQQENIVKTDSVELSADDEFISNFIAKDDSIKNAKIEEGTPKGMVVSRIAAVIALLFFLGVLYYSKVILPKLNQNYHTEDIIDDYEPGMGSSTITTTGQIELDAAFGDETILTQLKKLDYSYTKDMSTVDITLDYGTLTNGLPLQIKLYRSLSGTIYQDTVYYMLSDSRITAINDSSNTYAEDLITNIISSYIVNETSSGVIMYSKASTFQLGTPTKILLLTGSTSIIKDKVITTYSLDGSSIVQCPVTIEGDVVTYCTTDNFKAGSDLKTINKVQYTIGGNETIIETVNGMVTK